MTDRLTVGGDVRHVTGYYSDADNTSDYEVDPYTVANLSASYDLNDQFELYGYVNNVFDENEVTWVRSATGSASARVTDPADDWHRRAHAVLSRSAAQKRNGPASAGPFSSAGWHCAPVSRAPRPLSRL